jgi:hypothetical protein
MVVTLINNNVLVHGGLGASGQVLNDIWLFDLTLCTWT